jgi:hypothetical protein
LQSYIQEVKQKLSAVHEVNTENITIISITKGSVKINYTVKDLSVTKLQELKQK